MKRLARNFTCLSLMVVIFITTTGFSVFSHLCTVSGFKDVSISKVESCCSSDAKSPTGHLEKESCCETGHQYVKLETEVSPAKDEIIILALWSLIPFVVSFNPIQTTNVHIISLCDNLPPPKSGRDILTNHQTLLL